MADTLEPGLLHEPTRDEIESSNLFRYLEWLKRTRGLAFWSYDALWTWSIEEIGAFWTSIYEYFEVEGEGTPHQPIFGTSMPDVRWFEGSHLNYAENALRRNDDHVAIVYESEDGRGLSMTYAELRARVAELREGLVRLGVGQGDRVASLLPNCPEAVVALLATASLGAIWSSCSPDFGERAVLDRFEALAPKVLFAVDAYPYAGRRIDRTDVVNEIRSRLPSLRATVIVHRGQERMGGCLDFEEVCRQGTGAPLEFVRVPFDHPLWVLYSSGTTGLPKGIVHGHGGIVLELNKALALHLDLKPDDRFLWYTTTGWMMWNFLVSGLLLGTTVVLYEGSPNHPGFERLWDLADRLKVTYFGTSAPYLLACAKAGIEPAQGRDLSAIRAVGSTGAPLPVEGFHWVYEHVHRRLLLGSVSGGTDVCTAFVGSCPLLPVHAGEIQCRMLGAAVRAYGAAGESLVDEVGELVIEKPMPSMPVGFWNDADGSRLKESYFSRFPGVWSHGDWIRMTRRGSCIIYGRSDATLNRGGVRMGTSEFYRVVEAMEEVEDSLVVDTTTLGRDGKLWLFLVLADGCALDERLRSAIVSRLRSELSPRHVPDEIRVVPRIPRTLSGKKVEVPVRRMLLGTPRAQAVAEDALADPEALEALLTAAGLEDAIPALEDRTQAPA